MKNEADHSQELNRFFVLLRAWESLTVGDAERSMLTSVEEALASTLDGMPDADAMAALLMAASAEKRVQGLKTVTQHEGLGFVGMTASRTWQMVVATSGQHSDLALTDKVLAAAAHKFIQAPIFVNQSRAALDKVGVIRTAELGLLANRSHGPALVVEAVFAGGFVTQLAEAESRGLVDLYGINTRMVVKASAGVVDEIERVDIGIVCRIGHRHGGVPSARPRNTGGFPSGSIEQTRKDEVRRWRRRGALPIAGVK